MPPDLRRQEVGKNDLRPELKACHAFLAAGDTLVVPALDRYGRSLQDLVAWRRPDSARIVSPPSLRTSRCSTRHRDRAPPTPGRNVPAAEQLPGRASLSGASPPGHTVDPFAQQVGVADVARVLRDHVDVDHAQ
ncbi:recombinase family protein [Streptomyces sp. NBC_01224]|uniref:recombinase family protein n=1 Tax=Streptomyces sp. NBC_01224 TaxID=2903783 RepID=UPI002E114CB3